jgi:type I restriction enzyme M protein
MQDDAYLIAAEGWVKGTQPREIVQTRNRDNKLVWSDSHDYLIGRRRFKSDLVPAPILVARYFAAERHAIEVLDNHLAAIEQKLDEMREEGSGEEGLLSEVIEGEGDKEKIVAKSVKARLKEIGKDPLYAEERVALTEYADLLEQQAEAKDRRKAAEADLDKRIHAMYPKLTEAQIKALVVDDKWMGHLKAVVQGELDRVSLTLTRRIRELAERYDTPLSVLADEVTLLGVRVGEHLKRMGTSWA